MPEQDQSSDNGQLEVLPPSASLAIETASINSQISTAKAYPRSLQSYKKRAIDMATLDEETAESCLYRRPVGGGKFAEGMSVRMSEIVGASYGNLRVQATLVEQTERFVRARGMAIDLESNYASSSEVVESTVKKDGTPYDERMRVVIAKAALSKARRDALFQVVPRALAKPVENAVRSLLMGDTKTLEARRQAVVAWISKLGIDAARVYTALGVKGEADLGADQLETLTGLRTAIKDNEITLEEAFPAAGSEQMPGDPVVKRAVGRPKSDKGAAGAIAAGSKEVAGEVTEIKPPVAEPAPKPAENEVPKPLQRAFLEPNEQITLEVEVVSVEAGATVTGAPAVEAMVKGGFVGKVYHPGGATLVEGQIDPVPNKEWTPGNRLRLGLLGRVMKNKTVSARVETVEIIGRAAKTIED